MMDRLFATALHAVTVEVKGEPFIIDLRQGTSVALNGAAVTIWRGIARGRSPAEISRELVAAFGIDDRRAQADVTAFLSVLTSRGLVREELPGDRPG